MRFRNRVREVRLRRGLSVAELSRRSGVSTQTIFAIEGDENRGARWQVALALCKALNDVGLFWVERETDDLPPDEGV